MMGTLSVVGVSLALALCFTFAMVVASHYRVRTTPTHPVIEGSLAKEPEESLHVYYGGHGITKAVEDLWSPVSTIVEAVEKQCDYEVQVSKRLMEKRHHDLYPSHPWMAFVRKGGAVYLGWPTDFSDIGSESPRERYRKGPTREMYSAGHIPVEGSIEQGTSKEVVDLTDFFKTRPIQGYEAYDQVPLITGYDRDGRPIYARREVPVMDPDTGEHLGTVSLCETCGECVGDGSCRACGEDMRSVWGV